MIDIEQFKQLMEKKFTISPSKNYHIALAVSGGADSMCMALLFNKAGFNVICLIVDHGLRVDSSTEALFTSNFLNFKGIESVILKWQEYDSKRKLINIHQKARYARYELMTDYCKNNGISTLCTAHNKNDQAENVLIRIARGTGVDGLAEISEIQTINNITLIRPMLSYERPIIESTLKNHEWNWINDPSNEDNKFTRSRIRKIINDNKEDFKINRLALLASNANRTRDYLELQTKEIFTKNSRIGPYGEISLDLEFFKKLHEEMKLRLLSFILKRFNNTCGLRLQSLLKLIQIITNNFNKGVTLNGCEILKNNKTNEIIFIREYNFIKTTFVEGLIKKLVWDRRFLLDIYSNNNNLIIRALRKEDLINLKSRINQGIQFAHNKIKFTLPVITDEKGEILSCPALGWEGDLIKIKLALINE